MAIRAIESARRGLWAVALFAASAAAHAGASVHLEELTSTELRDRIAGRLGDAVVAPVLAYMPEGCIDPPTQHMRWAGTISIPEPVFEAMLGRRTRPAAGGGAPCKAHALREYYRAASADFDARLRSEGHAAAAIGTHAGLADTALALALARAAGSGVAGDPRRATAATGQPGLDHIVAVSVAAILADRQRR